jgi:dTDP-4-dehydrorhamnose reductase
MAVILVTGATGLLGSTLVPLLAARGHRVVPHGFRSAPPGGVQADLRDRAATVAMLDAAMPDCIINLAALTNVDACEADPQAAYLLNVRPVENIAAWLRGHPGSHLVHISTDQLYDGAGPHVEDAVTICNTYAFSKLAAELAAAGVPATVLRTNFFGPSRCAGRASFSDWLLAGLRAGGDVPVFTDVQFSPLSIDTLCNMIEKVAVARPAGVFNLGSRDGMSKADFAFALARVFGLPDAGLRPSLAAAATGLKARRPADMRLDSRLFETTLGVRLPALNDEILSLRSAYREQA